MLINIPLQPGEEIVPIQGYEGLYSITSFGRVWSHEKIRKLGKNRRIFQAKFLKLSLTKRGYLTVSLCRDFVVLKKYVHILVAIHFIENPQNFPEVNHKDTNKLNCRRDNLEWCTDQENHNHAVVFDLRNRKYSKFYGISFNKGKEHKKKPWQVGTTFNKKFKRIGYYKTEIEAAKAYNEFVINNKLNRPLNNL